MNVTRFETLVGLLLGIIAVLTALTAIVRWVYKQGSSSQKMVNSMDANTEATTELKDSFKLYTQKANGTLLDHEKRLTEVQIKLEQALALLANERRKLCHMKYGPMGRTFR